MINLATFNLSENLANKALAAYLTHQSESFYIKNESGEFIHVSALFSSRFDLHAEDVIGKVAPAGLPDSFVQRCQPFESTAGKLNKLIECKIRVDAPGPGILHGFHFPLTTDDGERVIGCILVEQNEIVHQERIRTQLVNKLAVPG